MRLKLRTTENGKKLVKTGSLGQIILHTTDEPEAWLFIAPHDDDILIGGGLLLQEAVKQGRRIKLLITSDGSQGYCFPEDQDRIAGIRRRETLEAYGLLGIPESDIEWLDFPDGGLALWQGRRKAKPNGAASTESPRSIEGFTGLENSFTYHLRAFRPSHLFLMSESDYHPDHKIVYQESLISIYHALGDIWPELGSPLTKIPRLYEMAAYCNFSTPPTIEIEASRKELQCKLDAIAVFKSQKQIGGLVENLKKNGPYEYFLYRPFYLYSPREYRVLFSDDSGDTRENRESRGKRLQDGSE